VGLTANLVALAVNLWVASGSPLELDYHPENV